MLVQSTGGYVCVYNCSGKQKHLVLEWSGPDTDPLLIISISYIPIRGNTALCWRKIFTHWNLFFYYLYHLFTQWLCVSMQVKMMVLLCYYLFLFLRPNNPCYNQTRKNTHEGQVTAPTQHNVFLADDIHFFPWFKGCDFWLNTVLQDVTYEREE